MAASFTPLGDHFTVAALTELAEHVGRATDTPPVVKKSRALKAEYCKQVSAALFEVLYNQPKGMGKGVEGKDKGSSETEGKGKGYVVLDDSGSSEGSSDGRGGRRDGNDDDDDNDEPGDSEPDDSGDEV